MTLRQRASLLFGEPVSVSALKSRDSLFVRASCSCEPFGMLPRALICDIHIRLDTCTCYATQLLHRDDGPPTLTKDTILRILSGQLFGLSAHDSGLAIHRL